jgi:di/tripeptidase
VKVDLRSVDTDTLDRLAAHLSEATEAAIAAENASAKAGRVSATMKETGSRPGGILDPSAPILGYIREIDRHLGIRSHPDCASTDANVPISLGLEAISIGAGGSGGGAHTPSEWYSGEGRITGLRRIVLLLALVAAGLADQ